MVRNKEKSRKFTPEKYKIRKIGIYPQGYCCCTSRREASQR